MLIKQAAVQGQPCCGSFTFTRLFAQQITSTIIFRASSIILGIVSTRFVFGCPSLKSIQNFLIIAWLSLGSIDWDKRARKEWGSFAALDVITCLTSCHWIFISSRFSTERSSEFMRLTSCSTLMYFFWVPYPKKLIIFFLSFFRVNIRFEFLNSLTPKTPFRDATLGPYYGRSKSVCNFTVL